MENKQHKVYRKVRLTRLDTDYTSNDNRTVRRRTRDGAQQLTKMMVLMRSGFDVQTHTWYDDNGDEWMEYTAYG